LPDAVTFTFALPLLGFAIKNQGAEAPILSQSLDPKAFSGKQGVKCGVRRQEIETNLLRVSATVRVLRYSD